jgi:preprotein translocase subunit SecG
MNAASVLFGILLFVTALFLILLVLVQRGRGGGLSGALGGMGGQSAFGTKAGDLFTRITIVVATVWILLCILTILVMNRQSIGTRDTAGEGYEFTTQKVESTAKPADSAVEPVGSSSSAGAKPAPTDSPPAAPAEAPQ